MPGGGGCSALHAVRAQQVNTPLVGRDFTHEGQQRPQVLLQVWFLCPGFIPLLSWVVLFPEWEAAVASEQMSTDSAQEALIDQGQQCQETRKVGASHAWASGLLPRRPSQGARCECRRVSGEARPGLTLGRESQHRSAGQWAAGHR